MNTVVGKAQTTTSIDSNKIELNVDKAKNTIVSAEQTTEQTTEKIADAAATNLAKAETLTEKVDDKESDVTVKGGEAKPADDTETVLKNVADNVKTSISTKSDTNDSDKLAQSSVKTATETADGAKKITSQEKESKVQQKLSKPESKPIIKPIQTDEPSMVAQISNWLTNNIPVVGGVIALLLGLVALLFVRNRRKSDDTSGVVLADTSVADTTADDTTIDDLALDVDDLMADDKSSITDKDLSSALLTNDISDVGDLEIMEEKELSEILSEDHVETEESLDDLFESLTDDSDERDISEGSSDETDDREVVSFDTDGELDDDRSNFTSVDGDMSSQETNDDDLLDFDVDSFIDNGLDDVSKDIDTNELNEISENKIDDLADDFDEDLSQIDLTELLADESADEDLSEPELLDDELDLLTDHSDDMLAVNDELSTLNTEIDLTDEDNLEETFDELFDLDDDLESNLEDSQPAKQIIDGNVQELDLQFDDEMLSSTDNQQIENLEGLNSGLNESVFDADEVLDELASEGSSEEIDEALYLDLSSDENDDGRLLSKNSDMVTSLAAEKHSAFIDTSSDDSSSDGPRDMESAINHIVQNDQETISQEDNLFEEETSSEMNQPTPRELDELTEEASSRVEIKLDLANSFVSIKEVGRAKILLEEVLTIGSPEQIEKASHLLKKID